MKKYYLYSSAEQKGPFDIDDLKSLNITKNTPIWFDGLPDWTIADKIEELKDLFRAIPPPFIPQQASPPPIQNTPKSSYDLSQKKEEGSSFTKRLLSLLGVIVLALLAFYIFNQLKQNDQSRTEQAIKSFAEKQKLQIRSRISDYVTVNRSSYNYALIGGIKNLSIIVTNNTGYMVDNVRVKVSYIKADGSLWRDIYLDFSYIPANNNQTIRMPDTDRGISVSYEIVKIKSTELELN